MTFDGPKTVLTSEQRLSLLRGGGAYRQALKTMLAGLSSPHRPGLHPLSTRDREDFALALLDTSAVLVEILGFYQDRIGNEFHLGTAVSPLSLRGLARLVGEDLPPAKSALTDLALQIVADADGNRSFQLEAGLKVRSAAKEGRQPQMFETLEPLEVNADWNEMTVVQDRPAVIDAKTLSLVIAPGALVVTPGQIFGLFRPMGPDGLGKLAGFGPEDPARRVNRVDPLENGRSRIHIAKLFEPFIKTAIVPTFQEAVLAEAATKDWSYSPSLQDQTIRSQQDAAEAARYWRIPLEQYQSALRLNPDLLSLATEGATSPPLVERGKVSVALPGVFSATCALFGHNANPGANARIRERNDKWDQKISHILPQIVLPQTVGSQTNILDGGTTTYDPGTTGLYLERELGELSEGQAVLIVSGATAIAGEVRRAEAVSVQAFGLSARVSKLTVKVPEQKQIDQVNALPFRRVTVHAVPQPVKVLPAPIEEPVEGTEIELSLATLGIPNGRKIAVTGELHGAPGAAVAEIREIDGSYLRGDRTVLSLTRPLTYAYERSTVRIQGNVVAASHGETAVEVLGDGDGQKAFQTFTLAQKPVSHRYGRSSTSLQPDLEIWVGDLKWRRTASLTDAGPADRVYELVYDEEDRLRVKFGDGMSGAKLPTGTGNVKAVYRFGAGPDGLIGAGQISQPVNKPAFIGSVANPQPSSGAVAAATLEDIRHRGFRSLRSLGRIVSLRDYEDFCLTFAGVAKARAEESWTGRSRVVAVTIAGVNGEVPIDSSRDYDLIRSAMLRSSDNPVPVALLPYRPVSFRIKAGIYVAAGHAPETVIENVRAALLHRFSFKNQSLGQRVPQAEVLATAHQVEGVRGVHLEGLRLEGGTRPLEEVLTAARSTLATGAGAKLLGMELLTLSSDTLVLEVLP